MTLPAEADVVARLRRTAVGAGEGFTLIFTPEGNAYRRLIEG
ncbi:hypothetical protein [Paractinoplanes aksuensis]|nr:hypothetical protein [Actinoplanes aksuensis]